MKSKICTACSTTDKKYSRLTKKAEWVGDTKHNIPPKTYMPEVKNLVSVNITMPQFAGRYVYYFAAESKDMLKADKKYKKVLKPKEAYDDYENRGVSLLNSEGKGKLVLSCPAKYYVKEDNTSYPSHVHFLVSNKKGDGWMKTVYTKDI